MAVHPDVTVLVKDLVNTLVLVLVRMVAKGAGILAREAARIAAVEPVNTHPLVKL